jgi:O-antigen polymerase
MLWIDKISSIVLILFLVLFYLSLSSVSMGSLMYPTQTGKTIYFLSAIMLLLSPVTMVILSGSHKKINISLLDGLLFVWFAYIITKSIIQKEPFPLNYAEFTGLAVLYMILRIIRKEHFLWLFLALIAGGILQAIYGNLQLWSYYPSHHNLFKLTGSFFNPGPYAGYLASVFPAALGFWIFSIRITREKQNPSLSGIIGVLNRGLKNVTTWLNKAGLQIKKTETGSLQKNLLNEIGTCLAVIALISIILVLPASRSRAAWLAVLGASAYLFVVKFRNYLKKWFNLSFAIKFSLIIFTVAILSLGLTGLYLMKRNSADGRLLVWKVTANMIADHPVTGTGIDGFKAHYMDYQAEYFRQNPDSKEAMVAGDTNYAFNELLQHTSEHGLVGQLMLVLVFLTALFSQSGSKGAMANKYIHNNNHKGTDKNLVIISKAVLISIVIFSMFSYTGQILPIKTSLILILAYLSGSMKNLYLFSTVKKKTKEHFKYSGSHSGINNYIVRATLFLTIAVLIFYGIRFIKTEVAAYKSWNYAFSIYNMRAYEQSIKEYKKSLPIIKYNGDFLTNYGKALSMAGEHDKAIKILQEAARYFPNAVVYTALGDSYKATGQNTKAESAYLHAWYMNPSRFYPKYLLAKLYDESGQTAKARRIAIELLKKEIKVESTAVKQIKEEMQKIVEK